MDSDVADSWPMTDRTNGRTPSLSFGTARTHQSLYRPNSIGDELRDSGNSDTALSRHTPSVLDVDGNHRRVAVPLELCEEHGDLRLDERSTDNECPTLEDQWLLNTRAHGLPLDTIIEQNSRSTLATRKSAPLLAAIFSVQSKSSLENITDRQRSLGKDGVRLTRSLDNNNLLDPIQTSRKDPTLDNVKERRASAQHYTDENASSSVIPPTSIQVSPDSHLAATPYTRRRTSKGIREIFQRLWASAQTKNTSIAIERHDVENSPKVEPPAIPTYDEKKEPEPPCETSTVPLLAVLSTCGYDDPAFSNLPTVSLEGPDVSSHITPSSSAVQHLDASFLNDPLAGVEHSAVVTSPAVEYVRKLLRESPGDRGMAEDLDSRSTTPVPRRYSSGNMNVGPKYLAQNPPPPHLTVRNGMPPSSPLSGRSICFGSSPPRQINAASDLGSLNRRIRASGELDRHVLRNLPSDQAEAAYSNEVDKAAYDAHFRSRCPTPNSSISSSTGWPSPLRSGSSLEKYCTKRRPRVDPEGWLFDPFEPNRPPSVSSTSFLAPSPLRPRPKPPSNILLFPTVPALSPFIAAPRPWRSFSSMLRLPSSTGHGSRPSTEFSCPHGKPMSRPNVYTGRKIKRHWWHTAGFATNGPEHCRKCSNKDLKLRFRQCIGAACFGPGPALTEDSDDMEPIQLPPGHRYNAPGQPRRMPQGRGHQRLSTIYSENCGEAVASSDMKLSEDCLHGSKDASGKCWRCKRDNIGDKFGNKLGRGCGVVVDDEEESITRARPVEVRTAMRRSLID